MSQACRTNSLTFHPRHKSNNTTTILIGHFLPPLSNETDDQKPFMFQNRYEGHLQVLGFNDASSTPPSKHKKNTIIIITSLNLLRTVPTVSLSGLHSTSCWCTIPIQVFTGYNCEVEGHIHEPVSFILWFGLRMKVSLSLALCYYHVNNNIDRLTTVTERMSELLWRTKVQNHPINSMFCE